MDGFDNAVDGYYDTADQLSTYFRRRAADEFAAEREGYDIERVVYRRSSPSGSGLAPEGEGRKPR